LIFAFLAIPIWVVTRDPTISVCMVTTIELVGFGPTVRKVIGSPWNESLTYFLLCVLKYGLAVLALDSWTIAAAIYPVTTCIAAVALSILIVLRRRAVPHPTTTIVDVEPEAVP